MMSPPIISTIIPVHNGACHLAAAIESVLGQTQAPSEVLVVDDGSTDATPNIAQSFGAPVRLLSQSNLGPAAARNLGIQHAIGDWLAFLDADDLWVTDKLARQIRALTDEPRFEAVLGRVDNFFSPELSEAEHHILANAVQQSGHIHVGTLLIHRPAFMRVGWFDTRWRQSEFVEWWARATLAGLIYTTIPELALRRRLHANNMTRRERSARREYLAMLREHIDRQREAARVQIESP